MPDRETRIDEIVRTARNLSGSEREKYLLESTAGDAGLYDGAQTRLSTEETVIVSTPRLWDDDTTQGVPVEALKIGNYRVIRVIDHGGMGIVYAGAQVEEGFQRVVAIKVVKPGLVSKEVLRRFRMERQFLANLDHPNIARLLDAGSTEDGAPYLVMEFVEGVSIDRYCDQNKLTGEERLKLFLVVCDALQYAHQHLIVHRDIKPSNILVNKDGVPKLLDFGIAKLIDDEGKSKDLGLTNPDSRPMTPMYASPEQVRGDTVTTASDIYSAGILLYQLLTGTLPYEFHGGTAAAIERTICETAPRRPSEAEFKREFKPTEPVDKVRKKLRGDLDMILMMALRKEPERRYASVYQFADDIRHHLAGHPVSAQGDAVGYKMGKFVRRHTAGVGAAALAVLALIAATIISMHFASVARQEKGVAERRFRETRDLARYFVTDMDDSIREGETTARRKLVSKGLEYLQRLGTEAAGDVSLQREVISGYIKMGDIQGNPFGPNIGDRQGARSSYERAVETGLAFQKLNGNSSGLQEQIAMARRRLADLSAVGGNLPEALQQYKQAVGFLKGRELADAYIRMGFVATQLSNYDEAKQYYENALSAASDLLSKEPNNLEAQNAFAMASERIGESFSNLRKSEEAIGHLKTAVKIYEDLSAQAPDRQETRRRLWASCMILGDAYQQAGRFLDAEQSFRRGLQLIDDLKKADPANTQYRRDQIMNLSRLADLLVDRPGRRAEARAMTIAALDAMRPVVEQSPDSYAIQQYVWTLVKTPFTDLRQPAVALKYAEAAATSTGSNDPRVLDMLALAQFDAGLKKEAIETERKALSLLNEMAGSNDPAMRSELQRNLDQFLRSAPAAKKD